MNWVRPYSHRCKPVVLNTGQTGIERIFIATSGKQLVSVDIKTGQPDSNFGDDGYVDLKQNLVDLSLR